MGRKRQTEDTEWESVASLGDRAAMNEVLAAQRLEETPGRIPIEQESLDRIRDYGSSNDLVREQMREAGFTDTKAIELGLEPGAQKGQELHHIVPLNERDQHGRFEALSNIMETLGISAHGVDNGVWVTKEIHDKIHDNLDAYAQAIYDGVLDRFTVATQEAAMSAQKISDDQNADIFTSAMHDAHEKFVEQISIEFSQTSVTDSAPVAEGANSVQDSEADVTPIETASTPAVSESTPTASTSADTSGGLESGGGAGGGGEGGSSG